MRLIVNGQQAFGQAVLKALLEKNEEVVGVYCAPDKDGRPVDPMKELAEERGIPVFQPRSFRPPEVAQQMSELKPDLCVMAYVTLFVPDAVLNVPTHGSIQYHPSLLPLHRGGSSINWPIIWGEKETGLTIFWPDDGLDEGPILLQKTVSISDNDTLGSLYFDRLFPMGVEAMLEAVDLVRAGKAPRVDQDHTKATYEGWCRGDLVRINWHMPHQRVWDLIRGSNPQPGAWTQHGETKVQIFDSSRLDSATSKQPGEVITIDENGIAVATSEGQILIARLRAGKGPKQKAQEWAQEVGLEVGARFS